MDFQSLEWRSFVAAMVGPQRFVWGMTKSIPFTASSGSLQLSSNKTTNKVFSVTVAVNQNALVSFSNTGGGTSSTVSNAAALVVGARVPFVLMPGDELFASTNPGTVFLVSQSVF